MALNLKKKVGAAPALISPPTAQSPDESFFIGEKTFNDGRTVWWSRPQPDKLTIRGMLLLEHFTKVEDTTKTFQPTVWAFLIELAGAAEELGGGKAYIAKGDTKKKLLEVRLPLGHRGSVVAIQIIQKIDVADKSVSFLMHMEMNPRKLGPLGFKALWDHLDQAGPADFHFHRFLADAWITRIDAAIDFAGVVPSELIMTAKGQGKRADYFGSDGVLETSYLHKLKKPVKKELKTLRDPMGRLIARMYDRNRERLARGKPPPYPGTTVTRVEVAKIYNNKRLPFWKIAMLADLFQEVRLSYADGLLPPDFLPDWRQYIAFRRAYGPAAAAQLNFPNALVPMAKRYDLHGSNLMDALDFEGWNAGIIAVGLGPLFTAVGEHLQYKKILATLA